MLKRILRLLVITIFISTIAPGCGKINIPKSIVPIRVIQMTGEAGHSSGGVVKNIARTAGGTLKAMFNFFRIKKSTPKSKEADIKGFFIETAEGIIEDIVENVVTGEGPLELVGDIVENVIEEAKEHLIK